MSNEPVSPLDGTFKGLCLLRLKQKATYYLKLCPRSNTFSHCIYLYPHYHPQPLKNAKLGKTDI